MSLRDILGEDSASLHCPLLTRGSTPYEATLMYQSAHSPIILKRVYNFRAFISSQGEPRDTEDSKRITFFADSNTLANSSILNYSMSPPSTPDRHRGAARARVRGDWEKPLVVKGKLADLPVTFHNRVKSSGYGRQEVASSSKRSGGKASQSKRSASSEGRRGSGSKLRTYDLAAGPTTLFQRENELPAEAFPLYRLSFNSDGSMLGVAAASAAVTTFRLPVNKHKGDGQSYMGHDARVLSCSFSNDRESVLSSSDDGTVRLWQDRPDAPVMVLSHYLKSPRTFESTPSRIQTLKSLRNKPFECSIKFAGFFFLDRLIAVCAKNSLLLYAYEIDKTCNDLKRAQSMGKYEKVYEAVHEGSQCITAAAFMNAVQSHLLLTSTSDKKLCVVDAAVGKIAAVLDSPHDKPVHRIALPSPSVHCPLPADACQVFCTASIDNAVVLWDLRASRSTGRFSGHVNRREEVGVAVSPCMRYLACGSEDRAARIVDLRMLRELARLPGHREAVSDVAYHPVFSQLATCSYDGSLRFHRDPHCPASQLPFI